MENMRKRLIQFSIKWRIKSIVLYIIRYCNSQFFYVSFNWTLGTAGEMLNGDVVSERFSLSLPGSPTEHKAFTGVVGSAESLVGRVRRIRMLFCPINGYLPFFLAYWKGWRIRTQLSTNYIIFQRMWHRRNEWWKTVFSVETVFEKVLISPTCTEIVLTRKKAALLARGQNVWKRKKIRPKVWALAKVQWMG